MAQRSCFHGTVMGFALACSIAPGLFGQSYYGSLRGIGSRSPGRIDRTQSKVTLTNEGSGEVRTAIASSSGEFVFQRGRSRNLHDLSAEAPGFKRFERKGVIVGKAKQQVSLDLKLEVGQVSESVQVTEEATLVESATASQGQVLDNQKVTELPNLGRNPFLLSKLVQNVIPVGNPAYNRMEDQSGSSAISISGRSGTRQQLLDRRRADHGRRQSRHHYSSARSRPGSQDSSQHL